MKVIVKDPTTICLVGGREIKEWRETQKVWVHGAEYTQKFKKNWWDGYTRPGVLSYVGHGQWSLKLKRGMLGTIRADFPNIGHEILYDFPGDFNVDIEDFKEVDDSDETYNLHKLRDYQRESLDLIFTKHWGRIALATNAGKGAVIGIAAGIVADRGGTVVILTDEVAVFQALQEEIRIWGGFVPELVESGRNNPPTSPITLAMIPTLAKRIGREKKPGKRHKQYRGWLKWLGTVDMCLLDEADRASAATWQAVLGAMPNTHFRVGFSGSFDTQKAENELVQKECMGDILIQIKNIELIDRKISARPLVQLVRYTQEIVVPPAKQWFEMTGPERRLWAFEEGIMYNENRHNLIRHLLEWDSQNAIVVNRVDHGYALADVLPDCVYLHGSDSKDYRAETLDQFGRGDFQNLITTKILDRGTNLLGHAIGLLFVSGEGSKTQTLQRVGRGLRKGDDKDYLFLKDIIDSPPEWYSVMKKKPRVDPYEYFINASRKRIALYDTEGFDVEIINDA